MAFGNASRAALTKYSARRATSSVSMTYSGLPYWETRSQESMPWNEMFPSLSRRADAGHTGLILSLWFIFLPSVGYDGLF